MKMFNLILITMLFAITVSAQVVTTDSLQIGKPGSSANKEIKFGAGRGTKPAIRFNQSTSKLEFSNDAAIYKALGSGSGSGSGINLLTNPGFEDGALSSWSNTGGTYAAITSGVNLLYELISVSFLPTATGQFFESSAIVVPNILYGDNCMVKISYQGADANVYLTVLNSSNTELIPITARAVLNSTAGVKVAKTYFTCPSSGSVKLRVQSTAAGVIGYFDQAVLGQADFQPTKQSVFLGQVSYGASFGQNILSQSVADVLVSPATSLPIYSGGVTAPTSVTNRIGVKLTNVRAGRYLIRLTGVRIITSTTASSNNTGTVFLGSDDINVCGGLSATGNVVNTIDQLVVGDVTCEVTIPNDLTSKEFWVKAVSSSATVSTNIAFNAATGSQISVYFFPSGNDTVVNSKCINDIACENSFSAVVNTAGAVSSESLDWLNTCTFSAPTARICTFNTGVFTLAPVCSVQVQGGSAVSARIEAISATGFTATSWVAGTPTNDNITVTCVRQGADFRAKQTITGFFPSIYTPVAFAANHTSGQSISSGSTSQVTFNIEAYDTNNGYNPATGTYIVPEAGKYKCSCRVGYASFLPGSPMTMTAAIFKNGGLVAEKYLTVPAVGNLYMPDAIGTESFIQGDTITCGSLQNSGVSRSLSTTSAHSEFSCNKVAN